MSTMTTTKIETRTVTGTNVLEVANAMWTEIQSIYQVYGKRFPYNPELLRGDLGQILLWEMCEHITVQFFEVSGDKRIERLSYSFVPSPDAGAHESPPGEFPRFEISPAWEVRVVGSYNPKKPEQEARKFYETLGWRPSQPLTRTGQGTTEQYGSFRSGGFGVHREVYKDFPNNTQTNTKEMER